MKHDKLAEDQDTNTEDDEQKETKPQRINVTKDAGDTREATTALGPQVPWYKNKKKLAIIAAIVIVVVVAIVLIVVLTRKKDEGPGDNPVTPVVDNYNPYSVDEKSIDKTKTWQWGGELDSTDGYDQEKHEEAMMKLYSESADAPKRYGVNTKTGINKGVNNLFKGKLTFAMNMISWRIAHFTLSPSGEDRYQVDSNYVKKPLDNLSMRLDMLGFQPSTKPFGFKFVNPVDKDSVYVDTVNQALFFTDKYIQMDFILPSKRVFGFGERVHEFQLSEGTWTMWATGQNSPKDDGSGRYGLYGVHPFILVQGKNKDDFFGMYFRNSNFQTPILKYKDDGTTQLSYITTGGIIDIHFYIHGSVKDIISTFQDQFGKPRLPPFWSLGWQQASYKWSDQATVENVIKQYTAADLPLDTVYLDIPYLKDYANFVVNTDKFKDIKGLAQTLHNSNQKLIVIVDAAVSADSVEDPDKKFQDSAKYYKQGNDDGVFIKSGMYTSETYNNNFIMKQWPAKTVLVDWFNDKCKSVWALGLNDLYDATNYDGIWIDMNEPTDMGKGELKPKDAKDIVVTEEPKEARFLLQDQAVNYNWFKSFDQSKKSYYNLPFVPKFDSAKNFDNMTASMNATHNFEKDRSYLEYDVHNLYGHMMAFRTNEFLSSNADYLKKVTNNDRRPFVLTRSSFTGSGQYASHWLGDNFRTWDYLKWSIPGIMNMNMFGIPHVGSDICGFFGDKDKRDDELCARWVQLATFYPVARFHYELNSVDNEPYLIQDEPYKSIVKTAMYDRYQYLRLMYTCMFEAYKYGGTCFDPLFYYFPTDEKVYDEMDTTFMVGGALKVTPILSQLKATDTKMKTYFPQGVWVNLADTKEYIGKKDVGDQYELSTTRNSVNVHLRPGSMIPFQPKVGSTVKTTAALLKQGISLYANYDSNNHAYGTLFLDSGDSLSELNNNNYEYYQFNFNYKTIINTLAEGNRGSQKDNHKLGIIKIFNAPEDFKDTSYGCYFDSNMQPHDLADAPAPDKDNAFVISLGDNVRFSDIHSIYWGTEADFIPCRADVWKYFPVGDLPTLDKPTMEFVLSNGQSPNNIKVNIRITEYGILNIKWTWADDAKGVRKPFEVPEDIVSTPKDSETLKLSSYIKIDNDANKGPFKIRVLESDATTANHEIFSIDGMVFDEYLNWINAKVTTHQTGADFKGIFGLGERANKDFFFKDGVYGMWTRDSLTPDETGTLPGNNMYGVHPFFMYKFDRQSWVGVFYKNAAAQDWWITNNKDNKGNYDGTVSLKTIAAGGVADIYIILNKPTPEDVVNGYFTMVGRPVLTPQWALGWNQCRWGYKALADVQTVVDGYKTNKIPLDVQWSDIDYLNKYRNFEYDSINYADLPKFVTTLHDNGMRYVPIIDAGIAYRPNEAEDPYQAYLDGAKDDVFMKIQTGAKDTDKQIFIGQVWPNDAVYPDYTNPKTKTWWQNYLTNLQKTVPFDGLWEDMNEASNFCHGICYQSQQPYNTPLKQKLKYIPTGRDLEYKSMALDAVHSDGTYQLDTHSLYGTQMVQTSHEWFTQAKKRTFIIERSSFAGAGKFTSRWLGDNFSEEKSMAYSVSGVMLMNMFGITMAGSDICGFIGNTTVALCTKWHVVGAFYPFSRNHNNWGQIAQEPWEWKGKANYNNKDAMDIMIEAVRIKYSLVRYYYTQLFDISTQKSDSTPATLFKPLFFEFPEDNKAYDNIIYNVMLGDSLKLSINPEKLSKDGDPHMTCDFYFPAGLWCSILSTDDQAKTGTCFDAPDAGQSQKYQCDIADYQLHLREGKIIPYQDTSVAAMPYEQVKTTKALQAMPVDLHILGSGGAAQWEADGYYINDDGETLDYTGNYNHYVITANKNADVFTLTFDQKFKAKAIATDPKCTAVNQNDYLSKAYFYNAQADTGYGLTDTYTAKATIYDGDATKDVDAGEAVYDANTQRLVYSVKVGDAASICMSTIKVITFTKKA